MSKLPFYTWFDFHNFPEKDTECLYVMRSEDDISIMRWSDDLDSWEVARLGNRDVFCSTHIMKIPLKEHR